MHAVQAIFKNQENPEFYVSPWYKKVAHIKAYSTILCRNRIEEEWPKSKNEPLIPQIPRKQPSRPKNLKRLELDEIGSNAIKLKRNYVRIKCSTCGQEGHNANTCMSRKNAKSVSYFNLFTFNFKFIFLQILTLYGT